jgi:hypothetical protein
MKGHDTMTEMTARHDSHVVHGGLAGWLVSIQRRLSDHVQADGDATARQHGWAITVTPGRLGFGGRTYRDPRFGQLAAPAAPPRRRKEV